MERWDGNSVLWKAKKNYFKKYAVGESLRVQYGKYKKSTKAKSLVFVASFYFF